MLMKQNVWWSKIATTSQLPNTARRPSSEVHVVYTRENTWKSQQIMLRIAFASLTENKHNVSSRDFHHVVLLSSLTHGVPLFHWECLKAGLRNQFIAIALKKTSAGQENEVVSSALTTLKIVLIWFHVFVM